MAKLESLDIINLEIVIPNREIGRFSLFYKIKKSGDLLPNRETWITLLAFGLDGRVVIRVNTQNLDSHSNPQNRKLKIVINSLRSPSLKNGC